MSIIAIVNARNRLGRSTRLSVCACGAPKAKSFQMRPERWRELFWSWMTAATRRRAITPRSFIANSRISCHVRLNAGGSASRLNKIEKALYFLDFPDIQTDQRRIEHIEALTGVLRDILGDELLPKPEEIIAIYGRVRTKAEPSFYFKKIFMIMNQLSVIPPGRRWSSTPSIFWTKKWIRLEPAFIWAFQLLITAANRTPWQHSMERHSSFEPSRICHRLIGLRYVRLTLLLTRSHSEYILADFHLLRWPDGSNWGQTKWSETKLLFPVWMCEMFR